MPVGIVSERRPDGCAAGGDARAAQVCCALILNPTMAGRPGLAGSPCLLAIVDCFVA
jgi:hypothetical protein